MIVFILLCWIQFWLDLSGGHLLSLGIHVRNFLEAESDTIHSYLYICSFKALHNAASHINDNYYKDIKRNWCQNFLCKEKNAISFIVCPKIFSWIILYSPSGFQRYSSNSMKQSKDFPLETPPVACQV